MQRYLVFFTLTIKDCFITDADNEKAAQEKNEERILKSLEKSKYAYGENTVETGKIIHFRHIDGNTTKKRHE
jgi:hypothetical protein